MWLRMRMRMRMQLNGSFGRGTREGWQWHLFIYPIWFGVRIRVRTRTRSDLGLILIWLLYKEGKNPVEIQQSTSTSTRLSKSWVLPSKTLQLLAYVEIYTLLQLSSWLMILKFEGIRRPWCPHSPGAHQLRSLQCDSSKTSIIQSRIPAIC